MVCEKELYFLVIFFQYKVDCIKSSCKPHIFIQKSVNWKIIRFHALSQLSAVRNQVSQVWEPPYPQSPFGYHQNEMLSALTFFLLHSFVLVSMILCVEVMVKLIAMSVCLGISFLQSFSATFICRSVNKGFIMMSNSIDKPKSTWNTYEHLGGGGRICFFLKLN